MQGPLGCIVMAAGLAAVVAAGWYAYQRYVVGPKDVEITWAAQPPEARFTVDLKVHRRPASGDPDNDMQLQLESKVLKDTVRIPWAEFGPHCSPAIPEGEPPRRGDSYRCRWHLVPHMKEEVVAHGIEFYIDVRVFWGGVQQHKMTISVQHYYHRGRGAPRAVDGGAD